MKNNLRPLLPLLLIFCTSVTFAQKDWVFQKEKNGVKVYKRKATTARN